MAMPIIFLNTSFIPTDEGTFVKMSVENHYNMEAEFLSDTRQTMSTVFGLARLFQFFYRTHR